MTLKITTFNCQGLVGNRQMVINTIKDNIILFLIEHWLTSDARTKLDELYLDYNILNFHSDMESSQCALSKPGRPFGGKCWFVKQDIRVLDNGIINDIVSFVESF